MASPPLARPIQFLVWTMVTYAGEVSTRQTTRRQPRGIVRCCVTGSQRTYRQCWSSRGHVQGLGLGLGLKGQVLGLGLGFGLCVLDCNTGYRTRSLSVNTILQPVGQNRALLGRVKFQTLIIHHTTLLSLARSRC